MPQFSHLHNHTQFSLLDGFSDIDKLYAKAKADNMRAIAITDHGNMFGVFKFVAEAWKDCIVIKDENGNDKKKPRITPIVGCEFYVVENRFEKTFTKDRKDIRFHQVLLAKNNIGYENLTKLCSLGYIEGMYSKYPRIDKSLIEKYHEGLIATTCCIGASVPQKILHSDIEEAEQELKWWYNIFGEDYYIEIQRHQLVEQEKINSILLKFSDKYKIPIIATNDSHYVDKKDANAHDILLCINTGEKQSTPGYDDFVNDDIVLKNRRFKFPNQEFYFKSSQEMIDLFQDIPEAIDNTNQIVDKIECLDLKKEILLPAFPIPKEFKIFPDDIENQYQYLRHLTFEGAKKRYSEIDTLISERLEMELEVIYKMKFSGYFLIVADFINAAKELNVIVGPGRGSAGGSVVAYCIGITGIDPIKYQLLFERFLNPERKSMPDIDTDFDDEGRGKVLEYVINKYSKNQVAHIVTFGTLAARSSIKDVARVLDLQLSESNSLTKLVPTKVDTTLKKIIESKIYKSPGEHSLEDEGYSGTELENIKKLREIYNGTDLKSEVIKLAAELEGSIKNTGVHASAIIIAPQDLITLMPISTAKNTETYVTQIEGSDIESAGVIKMDFLGLKTLSIIKNTLSIIKDSFNIEIDINNIPLNDEKTFQLFQNGDTVAIFQFESSGMQKYLKGIRPDKVEDLIALCALYRPGPMAYIDTYINRKFKRESVAYDLPIMKAVLEETYGITIYQEQVMILSQTIANFRKAEADDLRKAMGKKDKKTLDKKKEQFIEGGKLNNHPIEKLEKIWADWEAFASYAFNKSHATIYAIVAYQTAYLKANYPAAFMAACLNYASNTESISFFLEDCTRNNIRFFGPDINESDKRFTINKNNEIRFGLGGLKGVGDAAVDCIIEERKKNGFYKDIFDFFRRLLSMKGTNKRSIESLIYSGSFDSFPNIHRAMFFYKKNDEKKTNLEKIMDFVEATNKVESTHTNSLFSQVDVGKQIEKPRFSICEPWDNITQINYEKEVTGMYLSGHPLDYFKFLIQHSEFVNLKDFNFQKKIFTGKKDDYENKNTSEDHNEVNDFKEEETNTIPLNKLIRIAGLISNTQLKISKNNKNYITFDVEDYSTKVNFAIFGNVYTNYRNLIVDNHKIFIEGKFEQLQHRPDAIDFSISKIGLLESFSSFIRSIELNIDSFFINQEIVDYFENYCKKYSKGTVSLKINISDPTQGISICLLKLERIIVDDSLLDYLKKNNQIELKLHFK